MELVYSKLVMLDITRMIIYTDMASTKAAT